jgi:hypothetical protein
MDPAGLRVTDLSLPLSLEVQRTAPAKRPVPMPKKNYQIIACETVIDEMRPFMPPDMCYQAIEPGLHLRPQKLKDALQEVIDRISADTDTIILGYGLCSMAVIGLQAAESTLVVPRMDDCIAMLLGSQTNYKKQLRQEPGTYFLSKGWIESGINIADEFRKTKERHGSKQAELIRQVMFKNYTRLVFINLGYRDSERYRQFSHRAAAELNLRFEEIEGTPRLLSKIANGPWDDEFVVAPPGHAIRLEDFLKK